MVHEGVTQTVTQKRECRGSGVAHRARRWRASTMVLAILAAMLMGLAVTGTAAQAAQPPSDDRLGDQPSGWWMYNSVDATTLSNKLTENKARLTDLRVNSASPLTFTATMVTASGPYGTGYWWYYDRTRAQVDSLLATNNARPISLQKYWSGCRALGYRDVAVHRAPYPVALVHGRPVGPAGVHHAVARLHRADRDDLGPCAIPAPRLAALVDLGGPLGHGLALFLQLVVGQQLGAPCLYSLHGLAGDAWRAVTAGETGDGGEVAVGA